MEDFNAWLVAHQPLVTLVATPILSLVVGWIAARYSARTVILSARTERVHQSALEIGRYRQAWIDALRDDLAEFAGISVVVHTAGPPAEKIERVAVLAMRIRMRMNRTDLDYLELVNTLTTQTENFLLGSAAKKRGGPIVLLSQNILKREWERLKSDLREAEE